MHLIIAIEEKHQVIFCDMGLRSFVVYLIENAQKKLFVIATQAENVFLLLHAMNKIVENHFRIFTTIYHITQKEKLIVVGSFYRVQ